MWTVRQSPVCVLSENGGETLMIQLPVAGGDQLRNTSGAPGAPHEVSEASPPHVVPMNMDELKGTGLAQVSPGGGLTHAPLRHTAPAAQRRPHDPQLFTSDTRFASHPSPRFELQSANPDEHEN